MVLFVFTTAFPLQTFEWRNASDRKKRRLANAAIIRSVVAEGAVQALASGRIDPRYLEPTVGNVVSAQRTALFGLGIERANERRLLRGRREIPAGVVPRDVVVFNAQRQLTQPAMVRSGPKRMNITRYGRGYLRRRGARFLPRFAGRRQTPSAELKTVDLATNGGIAVRDTTHIGTAVSNSTAAVTTNISCLNSCVEGVTINAHMGRRQMNKSLFLNYVLEASMSGSTGGGDMVRCLLFWDLQKAAAATTFTLSDLLQSTSATSVVDVNCPLNLNNRDRFRVLYDKVHIMYGFNTAAGSVTTGYTRPIQVKKWINLRGVQTTYDNSATGVYGDITHAALMFVVFSNDDSLTNVFWQSRVRFTDM